MTICHCSSLRSRLEKRRFSGSLAKRLGSSTATLYRHFNSKEEILTCITDRILGQTNVEGVTFGTWQQACRAGARALYTTLTEHPNAVPLFIKQVPIGPGALAARERGIAVLLAAKFPPRLAARGYTALAHLVVGFALQQQLDETADSEHASQLSDFYRSLDPRTYPATTTVAELLPGATIDDEFEFGLNLIIERLENTLRTTCQTGSSLPSHFS
jgi:AcrR family transcriptional regulator